MSAWWEMIWKQSTGSLYFILCSKSWPQRKHILTTPLLGIQPMTFLSQIQRSATELSPLPSLVSLSDWHQRLQPLSIHSLWVTITDTIQPVSHNHWDYRACESQSLTLITAIISSQAMSHSHRHYTAIISSKAVSHSHRHYTAIFSSKAVSHSHQHYTAIISSQAVGPNHWHYTAIISSQAVGPNHWHHTACESQSLTLYSLWVTITNTHQFTGHESQSLTLYSHHQFTGRESIISSQPVSLSPTLKAIINSQAMSPSSVHSLWVSHWITTTNTILPSSVHSLWVTATDTTPPSSVHSLWVIATDTIPWSSVHSLWVTATDIILPSSVHSLWVTATDTILPSGHESRLQSLTLESHHQFTGCKLLSVTPYSHHKFTACEWQSPTLGHKHCPNYGTFSAVIINCWTHSQMYCQGFQFQHFASNQLRSSSYLLAASFLSAVGWTEMQMICNACSPASNVLVSL